VTEANFPAARLGPITFSEFPLNTRNPVYTPDDYTGGSTDPNAPTVRFAAFFQGQTAPGPVVSGQPSDPLTLDTNSASQQAVIALDSAAPPDWWPALKGAVNYDRPLAVRFSQPVASVGVSSHIWYLPLQVTSRPLPSLTTI